MAGAQQFAATLLPLSVHACSGTPTVCDFQTTHNEDGLIRVALLIGVDRVDGRVFHKVNRETVRLGALFGEPDFPSPNTCALTGAKVDTSPMRCRILQMLTGLVAVGCWMTNWIRILTQGHSVSGDARSNL